MELTSPAEMAKFAEDVRVQEQPFVDKGTELVRSLLGAEYKRLRAVGLESGESEVVLTLTLRANFDPDRRTIEVQSAPAPTPHKTRRRGDKFGLA